MTFIMAVDDDPEVLDTLGRVLERESFEVALARSARWFFSRKKREGN